MGQGVEKIADRIVICGALDIESRLRDPDVNAVFSFCHAEVVEFLCENTDFDQTQHHLSKFCNPPPDLDDEEFQQYRACAMQDDLEKATALLTGREYKKTLFHCHAGQHKSPTFVLLLLNHLQGDSPNFDLSLTLLHKIRPQQKIGDRFKPYKSFLGEQHAPLVQTIADFKQARAIDEKSRGLRPSDPRYTHTFNNGQHIEPEQIKDLCMRFGFQPRAFTS